MKKFLPVLLTGIVIGVCALALTAAGNPANMGFCIACFLRDIAGAIKLHSAAVVQYVRPEIIGIIVGAMAAALIKKEWKAVGGSSPVTRFLLAVVVMIGALVFLGCPLRMVIRIGGGDFNAIVGLVGFIAGIFVGTIALKNGFTLKRTYAQTCVEGSFLPIMFIVLMVLVALMPALFVFSTEGPGSMTAPVVLALAAGVIVGVLAQRSRFCMAGGIRDSIMFKDFKLLYGFIAVFLAALIGNLIFGKFKLGFQSQPVAHSAHMWNFLGMVIVGWGSVLLGGCPLRQLILAGSGNGDSAITVIGMIVGAAFSHNFGLAGAAASADAAGGVGIKGRIAIVIGFVVFAAISALNIQKQED